MPPYDPYQRTYQYVDEELGFPHQTTVHRAKQPLPRKDIEAAARQRNLQGHTHIPPDVLPKVRSAPANPHRTGHDSGLHGEDQPFITGDPRYPQAQTQRYSQTQVPHPDDEDIYDDEYPPRQHTSVVRYQPQEVIQHGNKRVHVGYVEVPPRRSAQQPPAAQNQRTRYTEDVDGQLAERRVYRRRIHVHWLVYAGLGAIIALILWISGAWLITWWTNTQNDWTYTQAFRTFSIDAVVGHNHDSASHPSHFIVQNNKRHIIIIELPADDISKTIIYSAPTLIGDGQERTPATISFQPNPQTGRVDMVLHVEDQTYLFTNNGVKFVTPQGQ